MSFGVSRCSGLYPAAIDCRLECALCSRRKGTGDLADTLNWEATFRCSDRHQTRLCCGSTICRIWSRLKLILSLLTLCGSGSACMRCRWPEFRYTGPRIGQRDVLPRLFSARSSSAIARLRPGTSFLLPQFAVQLRQFTKVRIGGLLGNHAHLDCERIGYAAFLRAAERYGKAVAQRRASGNVSFR